MDVTPLLDAPLAIQIHTFSALASLALAPIMLFRRKGDRLHKILGRIWVSGMAFTALSSFAIQGIQLIGAFSPIHALSLLTLYSLACAIVQARAGRIAAHKGHIQGAMAGLIGAGLFTLFPGRIMSLVIFPGLELQGFISVFILSAAALLVWRIRNVSGSKGATAPSI